jgi:hypothetical protein
VEIGIMTAHRITFAAAALLALGVTAIAHAGQPSGRIEGVVVDQHTRRPIVEAIVALSGATASATTGSDGRFLLADAAPGVQTLRVEAEGYVPLVYPDLAVPHEQPVTLVLEMVQAARYEEAVTVFAGPGPTLFAASSVQSLTNEEIRRSAGSFGDVQRFLQALPGQAPGGDVRNDLVTRGGSPVENLMLVDGFEVPSLNHLSTLGTPGGLVSLLNNELIRLRSSAGLRAVRPPLVARCARGNPAGVPVDATSPASPPW